MEKAFAWMKSPLCGGAFFCVLGFLILAPTVHAAQSKATEDTKIPSALSYVKALYAAPASFDPSLINDLAAVTVSNLIYSGLVEFTPHFEIRGDLAEKWETSLDGKTLRFTLKKGIRFHDGRILTASHVVRSFTRLLAPHSRVFSYYNCIEGANEYHAGKSKTVTGLIVLSDSELLIRLQYPFSPFLSILAGGTAKVLPDNVSEKGFFDKPIGSGPFEVKNIEKDRILLSRFENYFGKKPEISELVLDLSPQDIALKKAKEGKIHDLVSWTMSGNEDVFSVGQYVQAPLSETWLVGINSRLEPFNKIGMRQSFKRAFPVDAFRERFRPNSIPAVAYIPPWLPGHMSFGNYERADRDWIVREPSQTPIMIAVPAELDRAKEMAVFIEGTYQEFGWNVRAKLMAWEKLLKGYSEKTLQAFLISMNMDYPDPEFLFRNFESGNPDNFSGLHNTNVDVLIRSARNVRDRIEREKIYRELNQIIFTEAVMVELFHPRAHYWLHRCVRGFEPNLLSHAYTDYRTISLDLECMAKTTTLAAGK